MMLRSLLSIGALCGCLANAHAQLLIGQSADFSGPLADAVKEITSGARLYLDSINGKGGVNGQKIELLSLDDKFQPKQALENTRKLVEENNVLAMFLSRGTPQTQAVLPVLEKHAVPLIGPSTGAMVLHTPVPRFVFNVRATYQREAERIIAHLASIGLTRIAVVYRDDSFGKDGLAGAQRGLDTAKLKAVVLENISPDKPDVAPIAKKIFDENVQAVMLITGGKPAAEAVKVLREAGSRAQVVTLSNNAASSFITDLGQHARGVIVSQVFPSERSDAYPMVKEARALAKAQDIADVSPAMLEGYAAAKVLVEGLRRAGPQPTREKLLAALEGIKKFDLGGLEVSYAPDDHTGLDFADLSIIGPSGKFRR